MAAHIFENAEPLQSYSTDNGDAPLFAGQPAIYQRLQERKHATPWLLAGVAGGAVASCGFAVR